LATNGLVVDEHTYITSPEHTMVAEELARRGIEVELVPYDAVSLMGGAFRCSHHPLVRER
jgi:N-dimethylarginine dimethylaminohydrolase